MNEKIKLIGRHVKVGDIATKFKIVSEDMSTITLEKFEDKIKILMTFPSLDTRICDLQVKRFNEMALGLSKDIVIIGISRDLPFAIKRFCLSNNIDQIYLGSDYKTLSFGLGYGVLIKEMNLLARAAFIVDKQNIIRYVQIAEELSIPLNYEEIMVQVQHVLQMPKIESTQIVPEIDFMNAEKMNGLALH